MFNFIFDLILFVSLFRSTGKRFDVAYGARGCLASGICMLLFVMAVMALFSLGLTNWLDLIPGKAQNGLGLLMWFLALCLGGYHAARLGRTTGWTNSLIVGMFAESFLLAMLLDKLIKPDWPEFTPNPLLAIFEKPLAYWGRLPGRLFDHLIEMLQEPLTNWGQLAGLFFAIPAAVLGGVVWQRSHPNLPQLPPNTGPHKQVTLMNTITIIALRFPILGLAILCLVVLAIVFRNDPAAVEAIKDRGGVVKGDPVVSVTFPSSASVKDVDLKLLKELKSMKTLNLNCAHITDEGLKVLKELKNLQMLNLRGTGVTDAGIKQFKVSNPGTTVVK